jgi:hypothetical protein
MRPFQLPPSRLIVFLLALAVASLGGGCGTIKEDTMAQSLYLATKGYRESIRWGYFEAAAGFLHPDERADIDFDSLENVRVTGYEVIQPAVISADQSEQRSAVQLVRVDYVLEDEQRLKHLTDRQDWRWDDERSTWWLHTPMPAFAD